MGRWVVRLGWVGVEGGGGVRVGSTGRRWGGRGGQMMGGSGIEARV